MYYDLSKELDRQRFKAKVNKLYEQRAFVDITKKTFARTLKQNAYLHLLLSFLAYDQGCNIQYVKEHYYKREANRDLFVYTRHDELLNATIECVRSTSSLNREEMALSIERLKNWAGQHGIYLPEADNEAQIREATQLIDSVKEFL